MVRCRRGALILSSSLHFRTKIIWHLFVALTEEQERIQKKTFTNWINTYLAKVGAEFKVDVVICVINDVRCFSDGIFVESP